jgi:hypothetical protein
LSKRARMTDAERGRPNELSEIGKADYVNDDDVR